MSDLRRDVLRLKARLAAEVNQLRGWTVPLHIDVQNLGQEFWSVKDIRECIGHIIECAANVETRLNEFEKVHGGSSNPTSPAEEGPKNEG